jgi:hypothetical protein
MGMVYGKKTDERRDRSLKFSAEHSVLS